MPIVHERKVQAREHALTVDVHCASAALAVVATFLCSRQRHRLANTIQQRRPRIYSELMVLAINPQSNWDRALDSWRRVAS
jgi:hypothetical protein